MPTIEDRRRPIRIGFLVALIASSALHAGVFVVGGFLPSTAAHHGRRDLAGSEYVIELRLSPPRNPTLETHTPANPAVSHDPLPAESKPALPEIPVARATDHSLETALGESPLAPALEQADTLPLVVDAGPAHPVSETPSDASRELTPARSSTDPSRAAPPTLQQPRLVDEAAAKEASPPAAAQHAKESSAPRAGETRGAAVLTNPRPTYPSASRRLGEEGEVVCLLHVRADGTVEQVEVLRSSGFQRLDRAATDGLKRWRFTPALENGTAVATTVRHKVTFVVE